MLCDCNSHISHLAYRISHIAKRIYSRWQSVIFKFGKNILPSLQIKDFLPACQKLCGSRLATIYHQIETIRNETKWQQLTANVVCCMLVYYDYFSHSECSIFITQCAAVRAAMDAKGRGKDNFYEVTFSTNLILSQRQTMTLLSMCSRPKFNGIGICCKCANRWSEYKCDFCLSLFFSSFSLDYDCNINISQWHWCFA